MAMLSRSAVCLSRRGAVVVLITAVLSACGSQTGGRALDESGASEVQRYAQATFDRMYGSLENQSAAQFLVAWELNHGLDECMAERGFPDWDPTAAMLTTPTSVDALGATLWLRDPARRTVSDNITISSQRDRAVSELENGPRLSTKETASVNECSLNFPGPSDDTLDTFSYLGVASDAYSEFAEIVQKIDRELGGATRYFDCMNRAGFALEKEDWAEPVYIQLSSLVASEAPPLSARPAYDAPDPVDARWTAFTDFENSVLNSDYSCRRDEHLRGLGQLAPLLSDFVSKYASDLDAYDAHWREVTQVAKQRGWTGFSENHDAQ